jgi:hydrogenase expression/formation protein HypC
MCLGVPGRVVEIVDAAHGIARVETEGRLRDVSIALLTEDDPVSVDDWVLVHMGFAMAKTDAEEAAHTHRMLEELVQAYDDEIEGAGESRLGSQP